MAFRRLALPLLALSLLAATSPACVARRRLISRAANTKALQLADLPTLLAAITRQYDTIRDFSGKADMVPATGSAEKNRITEYKGFTAYIRFRKPSDIRVMALAPVVLSKVFDMVSDGAEFRLYLPTKNRFIVGRNTLEHLSADKLENLRPQMFLDALVVRPVDTAADKVMIENFTDEDNAYYIVHEIRELPTGVLKLRRTIWFERVDLQMARQLSFDDNGNIVTDARYSQWHRYDNVPFPRHIEINWPRDEYAVVLDMVKMDINHGVASDQFELERPEGTILQTVGPPPAKGTHP